MYGDELQVRKRSASRGQTEQDAKKLRERGAPPVASRAVGHAFDGVGVMIRLGQS